MDRCDTLACFSEEPGRLTRRFATPALREAGDQVAAWMREAGLEVRRDAVGNLIGRREGRGGTLMLGSHLDTVVDAGRYDGALGVLVAIECAARAERAVEVVAFADEEGVRYGTAYLGSAALAGRFDPAWLERVEADGVRLGDLLEGLLERPRDDLAGYLEVHIEQAPRLEAEDVPVGVVSGIVGQTRARVEFAGRAGHAGTVPMELRRDALCAAAEFVLAVESAGSSPPWGRRAWSRARRT
jgi:allantoate deiminase